jgi:hypothetical protein
MQTDPTKVALPAPLALYFANEMIGPEAVARCFTHDAVVLDERHEHRGHAAIATWNAASKATYSYTTEPLSFSTEGDVFTVAAKVIGTFAGSPVELRFRFTLDGSLIARLEIAP